MGQQQQGAAAAAAEEVVMVVGALQKSSSKCSNGYEAGHNRRADIAGEVVPVPKLIVMPRSACLLRQINANKCVPVAAGLPQYAQQQFGQDLKAEDVMAGRWHTFIKVSW
jgi:hypothetical protein